MYNHSLLFKVYIVTIFSKFLHGLLLFFVASHPLHYGERGLQFLHNYLLAVT